MRKQKQRPPVRRKPMRQPRGPTLSRRSKREHDSLREATAEEVAELIIAVDRATTAMMPAEDAAEFTRLNKIEWPEGSPEAVLLQKLHDNYRPSRAQIDSQLATLRENGQKISPQLIESMEAAMRTEKFWIDKESALSLLEGE